MPVEDEAGNDRGFVQDVVNLDPQEPGRFVVVEGRLLPVEAIRDLVGGRVRAWVDAEKLFEFPERRSGGAVSPEAVQEAYRQFGELPPR